MDEPNPNSPVLVNIRLEGRTDTIFEGTVKTHGHDVTAETGGTHPADGTNGNEYPFPVPTCTAALADVAIANNFTWDGQFFPSPLDDVFINKIKDDEAMDGQEFWQLALNFKPTNLGGGQVKIRTGDSVVWALIKKPQAPAKELALLKLRGPRTAMVDLEFTVAVIDGETREPVEGAKVGDKTTDYQGQAKLTYTEAGTYDLKAEHKDKYVRSNVLSVTVTSSERGY